MHVHHSQVLDCHASAKWTAYRKLWLNLCWQSAFGHAMTLIIYFFTLETFSTVPIHTMNAGCTEIPPIIDINGQPVVVPENNVFCLLLSAEA